MKKSKNRILMGLFLSVMTGGLFYSCNEKVNSRPNYIFKPAPKQGVAIKVLGKEVNEDQLYKGIEGDLYEAEYRVYDLKMGKMRAYLLERFMENHPDKKKLTNDEFLDKYISDGKKPGEKEVDDFIKEKNIPKEHINAQLRERVKGFLDQERKRKMVDTWLDEQIKKSPVEVYINKPMRPVFEVETAGSPFSGKEDAKVTLVEYSDFQCPYCARGSTIIADLKKKYGDKLKVVFRNFPLPFHQHAKGAAEAGLCINDQGKEQFWKMHDLMFGDQEKLALNDLKEKAKKAGADADKFEKCLSGHQFVAKVDADIASGEKLGIKSTPTFYVNGKLISGAQPTEVFEDVIEEEMNK